MIKKVISGGQTGADLAGLRAAKACGIATGGWAPKGYRTENGPRPFLLGEIYGLKEHASPEYPPRTLQNIRDSDLTLIIARELDGGSKLTVKLCFHYKVPAFFISSIDFAELDSYYEVLAWVLKRKHEVINIAGNRENKCPGIGAGAEVFLRALFHSLLKHPVRR